MTQANYRKDPGPSEIRVVVEVDGSPVGCLSLDIDRLWPLINHGKRDSVQVEWMDQAKFESILCSAVMKRMVSRIEGRLYQTLGDEMVKAGLDVENFNLKAQAAAQAFGTTKADIEKLATESGRTSQDFHSFFWEYLISDREITDLKKEWKTKGTLPR
jgi:hypothetical protein